jgi:hypothetical protein
MLRGRYLIRQASTTHYFRGEEDRNNEQCGEVNGLSSGPMRLLDPEYLCLTGPVPRPS